MRTGAGSGEVPGKVLDGGPILAFRIALILAVPLIGRFWNVPAFERYLPPESQWFMFAIGRVLIAGFVLACGWVEDVAAKKKPRPVPGGRAARMGG